MTNIKAAIFDLDGTLIDSMSYWTNVDKEFLSKRKIQVPDCFFTDVKSGNSFTELAAYFKEKLKLRESKEEIMLEWTLLVAGHYKNDIKLKPGAQEFLDLLTDNNIKMGVGTSNSMQLAGLALQANGIHGYFDTIVTGCRDIKGKPFPDIFLKVASNIGIEPDECIVIEDTLIGIQAAKKAGMTAIAIFDHSSEPDKNEIKKLADYYGEDFYQIIDYFNSLQLI